MAKKKCCQCKKKIKGTIARKNGKCYCQLCYYKNRSLKGITINNYYKLLDRLKYK